MSGRPLSWGHINVNVADLDRSIAFYEQLGFAMFLPGIPYLGLTAEPGTRDIPEPGIEALGLLPRTRGRGCIMQLGDGFPKLDLTELAEPGQLPLGNADLGLVRICLASSDLAADHARLTERGVVFLTPPRTDEHGLAGVAVCVDPDGTLIELIQIHPERWASVLTDRREGVEPRTTRHSVDRHT